MKNRTNKILAVALAVTLLALAIVVGTFAYLADTDNVVTNTFTVGANVNITLDETGATDGAQTFKIIPGEKDVKDPTLTVDAGSDSCWVYVEVIASAGLDAYVDFDIADGWTTVNTGDSRVIYGRSTAAVAGNSFQVLAGEGDGEYANGFVFYENVSSLPSQPMTLTFKGYAIQADGFATSAAAWAALDAQMNPPAPQG